MLHTNPSLLRANHLLVRIPGEPPEYEPREEYIPIPLSEIVLKQGFNTVNWVCIRQAVLPNELGTLADFGQMLAAECRDYVAVNAGRPELKYGSYFAKEAIKDANDGYPFNAVFNAIISSGISVREVLELEVNYARAYGIFSRLSFKYRVGAGYSHGFVAEVIAKHASALHGQLLEKGAMIAHYASEAAKEHFQALFLMLLNEFSAD